MPFNPQFYCHKFKKAGLHYEVGIGIFNGLIVWAHGPFKCGTFADVAIFRSSLKQKLLQGEVVLTDGGYPDGKCVRTIPNTSTKFSKDVRARHEAVNGRLKSFKVLKHVFRHSMHKHRLCFMAVAQVIQIELMIYGALF